MSWQAYVDDQLIATKKVTSAAIVGIQGRVWAASAGYQISPEEEKKLTTLVNQPEAAQAEGIRLHGVKFVIFKIDDLPDGRRSLYGRQGADGVVIVKTKQAILIGEYKAPLQAAETTPVVEKLADYLIGVGY